jgi:hypothetical protein
MFLRAIGNVYGSDRAMEMWLQLADTINPDLKGWTFEAMLLGRMESSIVITNMAYNVSRIGVIKAIRTYDRRGLGLKEAKDMVEGLIESGKEISLEITYDKVPNAAQEFKILGCQGLGI